MGITAGVAIVGAGMAMDKAGGDAAAEAAQGSAMARQNLAWSQYRGTQMRMDAAYDKLEGRSFEELNRMDQMLAAQDRNLARQEKLVAEMDPVVLESSQQALKLLRGERASVLGPVEQQRKMQRQTLLNTLRAQLGPGAETSTAGIQALTKFDQETANVMAQAQQGALAQMGATGAQYRGMSPDLAREIGFRTDLGAKKYGISQSMFDAEQARTQQRRTDFAPLLDTAGAEYTGAMMKGQNQQAMGGSLMGMGSSIMGGGFGKMGGTPSGGDSPTGGSWFSNLFRSSSGSSPQGNNQSLSNLGTPSAGQAYNPNNWMTG